MSHPARSPRLDIMAYIIQFKRAHDGNSPTVREVADNCGMHSTSVARFQLDKLEAAGLIQYGEPYKSRMICVVGGSWTPPSQIHKTRQDRLARFAKYRPTAEYEAAESVEINPNVEAERMAASVDDYFSQ